MNGPAPWQAFAKDCEAEAPSSFLIANKTLGTSELVEVKPPFALVGKTHQADIPLKEHCSWRQVYLQLVRGRWFFLSLNSPHVSWKGIRKNSGWLLDDTPLEFGPWSISLQTGMLAGQPLLLPDCNPMASNSASFFNDNTIVLEFLNSSISKNHGTHLVLNRLITLIGRASACRLRFHDTTVSNFHASLVQTARGLWVVDLSRRNGVFVNDDPVTFHFLNDSDIIRVGSFQIKVHYDDGIPQTFFGKQPATGALPSSASTDKSQNRHDLPAIAKETAGEGLPLELLQEQLGLDAKSLGILSYFHTMQDQMMARFEQTVEMLVGSFLSLQNEQMDLLRSELTQIRSLTEEINRLKAQFGSENPQANRDSGAEKSVKNTQQSKSEEVKTRDNKPAKNERPASKAGQPIADPVEVHQWIEKKIANMEKEKSGRLQKLLQSILGK